MLDLVTIPCLKDNYAYLLRDSETGQCAVVDVPDAIPVIEALVERRWKLGVILITHHHSDHIDGVARLVEATGAKVLGARADSARLPRLDRALVEGDRVTIGAEEGVVLDVSGHTMGHIAFHFPKSGMVFTADSLMAGGCGRLFEGTPATMWASLQKLAALPPEGEFCALYTDLLVREDLLQLFGFPTMLEKEWHKLLMTVQGVGAKASMKR